MLRRGTRNFLRQLSTMSSTPIEDSIRLKVYTLLSTLFPSQSNPTFQITQALNPSTLEIKNDSANHAHHKAMQGSISKETHFRLVITSEAFRSKMQPARHRMVYTLLKEELEAAGGIHALQLKTRTLEEEERQHAREQAEQGQPIAEVKKP